MPLSTQHLPLLHEWLNQPHMRAFYQPEPISLQQVTEKYQNRIDCIESVICHIVCSDNLPFGFIQSYKISDYPDYANQIQESTGISLDLFIGDPLHLHQGFERRMLQHYLHNIILNNYPRENQCYINHEIDNISAIKCSVAAGFIYVRDVIEDGKACQLFMYDRCSIVNQN